MKFLSVLCEGVRDEVFYTRICERVTGLTFLPWEQTRLRRGASWKNVIATAEIEISKLKYFHGAQDIALVIAVDNDRAPGHPGAVPPPKQFHDNDRRKQPRHTGLASILLETFGANRATWPVDIALAVPVEMLESWLLLLWNPQRPTLPFFAKATQQSARLYHGGNPPPQLKDLCHSEAGAAGIDLDEFVWQASEKDLDAAAAVSESFKMFLDDLKRWRPPQN